MTFIYWLRLLFWSQMDAQTTRWMLQPNWWLTMGFPSLQLVSVEQSIVNAIDIPSVAGPQIFIWALPVYLQYLQFEIHVLFIWIHWIWQVCWQVCAKLLFLSVWKHSCRQNNHLPSTYVRISEWLIFLLCCLYKSLKTFLTLWVIEAGFPLLNIPAHECILIFTHKFTFIRKLFLLLICMNKLLSLSSELYNNYCSLADGFSNCSHFSRGDSLSPPSSPLMLKSAPLVDQFICRG